MNTDNRALQSAGEACVPEGMSVLQASEQEILCMELSQKEVQVVDLLTPMVDLVVLVLLLFDTNHNK